MAIQRIALVEYQCSVKPNDPNHTRRITFGEKPSWWPDQSKMPTDYRLETTSFFSAAVASRNESCPGCATDVLMIRVGPQPE